MKRLLSIVLLLMSFGGYALAQKKPDADHTITGRVIASGGFPIANARVMARAAGGPTSPQMVTTDDDGKFELTNLRPANYRIRVTAAGYILEPSMSITPATLHRPGENVTLRVIKGGVITGRVVNANGEPIALARVRAMRVKDPEGRVVRDSGGGRDWTTDDRGSYRIYGLEPGGYVVAASSSVLPRTVLSQVSASGQNTPTAPTYYPSSTLDSATIVNVYGGDETRSIEIRARSQSAYLVRGAIVDGATRATSSRPFISVTLSHAATGVSVASITATPSGPTTNFNFDGVPDGVYELTALIAPGTSDAAVALPQRVTVRGANVTDVALTLMPFASVTGRVVLEPTTATANVKACDEDPAASPEAILINALRDKAEVTKQTPFAASSLPIEAQPDARGEFSLTDMTAGRYSLDVRPPSRLWYVRDIGWTSTASTQPKIPSNSFTLKHGERLNGLTIKLARGAASIAGRVSPASEGAALPELLRIHVVPVEREYGNDVLRHAETLVQPDGTFSIAHLAPGRYWLLARTPTDRDTAKSLRREAEKTNIAVELQPCQPVVNYVLRFTP